MIKSIYDLKAKGKKIGFTASTFDLLHSGHIMMLAEARSKCDYLIAGILVDPTFDRPNTKNKPIQSIFERWTQLQAVCYVDLIIPFESEKDLYDLLLAINPDIRIVGEEYKNTKFTGYDISDIEIYFNTRKHNFSTTELRKKIIKESKNIKNVSVLEKVLDVEKKI